MTAYKRPVFFDRDIKSFSELSDAVELDLGLVARSILADAYLQVGTTDSAGTVSVKDAADGERWALSSYDVDGDPSLIGRTAAGDVRIKLTPQGSGSLAVGDYAGDQTLVQANRLDQSYNGQYRNRLEPGNFSMMGPDFERFALNASAGLLTMKNDDGSVRFSVDWDNVLTVANASGVATATINAATATATLGTTGQAGTVSVKNADNFEAFKIDADAGRMTVADAGGDAAWHNAGYTTFVTNESPRASFNSDGFIVWDSGTVKSQLTAAGHLTIGTAAEPWLDAELSTRKLKLFDGQPFGSYMEFDAATRIINGVYKIYGLDSNPDDDSQAASKGYVDAVAQGLDVKASCVTATTENITLAGLQTVGGVALAYNDRVLVKNQTDAAENGIYVVYEGLPTWYRAADLNADAEFPGAFTFIEGGTYQGTGWVCTNSSVTLGTTAITFTQFSGAGAYTAGTGISFSGTVINAVVDGTHAIINGSNQIDVAGLPALFTIAGSATSANVTAANLNTLTAGQASDAKGLLYLSADAQYLPAATGLAALQACIVNSSGEAEQAGTTASGAWILGVVESIADGQARVVRGGVCTGFTGLTAGAVYYVAADGTLADTLPTSGRAVMAGIALSATTLSVQIRDFGSILAA